jgi:hypothetical protein
MEDILSSANFYEKALFVKVDGATALGLTQLLLCPSRVGTRASMAIRSGSSEAKRRLKASGLVGSLPSSMTSPLSVSMRHRGRSTCLLCPIRLSYVDALCYHPWWADLLLSFGPLAREPAIAFADPKGTA